ncbi:hypothetical protein V4Y02_23915 [Escherichia coli]
MKLKVQSQSHQLSEGLSNSAIQQHPVTNKIQKGIGNVAQWLSTPVFNTWH